MAQSSTATLASTTPRRTMTYDEFLAWAGEDVRAEWVEGRVIVFMPTTVRHADLAGFLYTLLSLYTRFSDHGRVFFETVEMRLRDSRSSRRPDLLFVAREHLNRLTRERLDGPADIVVELISDDSVTRDRDEKFHEYQAAGIPEYWLLDSRHGHEQCDFYCLIDGVYQAMALDADGRYHSTVLPGFWLRPDWLWQEPLPNPLDCLVEIAPDTVAATLARGTGGESKRGTP